MSPDVKFGSKHWGVYWFQINWNLFVSYDGQLHCPLDRIWNHLGRVVSLRNCLDLVGLWVYMSMGDFPNWVNGSGKSHPEWWQHHITGWALTLTMERTRWVCARMHPLSPCSYLWMWHSRFLIEVQCDQPALCAWYHSFPIIVEPQARIDLSPIKYSGLRVCSSDKKRNKESHRCTLSFRTGHLKDCSLMRTPERATRGSSGVTL